MGKIDDYINNIYKNFDETDSDTKMLKEETKSHLYDEVEELKKQGLGEDESIERAISNFGQENIVVEEMDTVLKKQNKFSKILIRVALMIYIIGCIFKLINLADDFLGDDELWQQYVNDKYNSDYVIETILDKIKDKDSLDENIKNEITILLDEFNMRTDNGLYYVGIEKSGKYYYKYNKDIPEDLNKKRGGGGINGKLCWSIHHEETYFQREYEREQSDIVWDKMENAIPYRLNELSNYLFIISWILVCVSLINRAYIKNLISKSYIAFFVCPTVLILAIFSTGKHTSEESMILLTGIMMILSKFYSKYYFRKCL
ncbi:permease prefix domain 1-containing protein [Clostridium taeniosporum]|uniref:Uncharacterized protein n=1 Tax=Clostridium taeniosporum TaxID=394958 RepID=A0A1D7XP83_9CLOT|nr:permease prefix domain 1-containing protein [Clostridium taeniosporum]AOR25124.1 hypothetical protein BGI42_15385 [Clostridium taeniosporum]